ncbi:MAG: hypothetical protein OK436_06665 [Thaumarchaeota archaeon]|nr:hypothetical protein [Nitrososphaerota archaeon]
MVAIHFEAWRYSTGGIQSLPSTSAASNQLIPTIADGSTTPPTARFVFVQAVTSSVNSGGMTGYIRFDPSSSAAATSSDCPVTSNEGRIFRVQGTKWFSTFAENAGVKINIVPIEF